MPETEHSTEYESFLEDIKFNEMIANGYIKNSIAVDFKEVDPSQVTLKHHANTGISS